MRAAECHARGRAAVRGDEIVDRADIVAERFVYRAHVGDEAVLSASLRPERSSEAEVFRQDLAGDRLVGTVPDLVVEALELRLRVGVFHRINLNVGRREQDDWGK